MKTGNHSIRENREHSIRENREPRLDKPPAPVYHK